jgi:RNA polymerase sigma factor (sigma-70 family)
MIKKGDGTVQLWKNFIAGDKEAFAHFYNLHVEALYRYGTKICADENLVQDALQEIFLDLYIKKQKNTINPERLKFYLIISLKHNLIKKIKRSRRLVAEESCDVQFETEYSIETNIIKNETEAEVNRKLNKLLNNLPAKQKEALYLHFNEGLDYREVAKVLNISVESARKQVYRALFSIRNNLDKKNIILFLYVFINTISLNLF